MSNLTFTKTVNESTGRITYTLYSWGGIDLISIDSTLPPEPYMLCCRVMDVIEKYRIIHSPISYEKSNKTELIFDDFSENEIMSKSRFNAVVELARSIYPDIEIRLMDVDTDFLVRSKREYYLHK